MNVFFTLRTAELPQNTAKMKNWKQRKEFIVGIRNVMSESYAESKIALIPPLYTKLGLMK